MSDCGVTRGRISRTFGYESCSHVPSHLLSGSKSPHSFVPRRCVEDHHQPCAMIPLEQELSQTLVGGPGPNATPPSHVADSIPAPAGMFGSFALLRELGQGGGGHVYLASQPQLAN